MIYVFIIGPTTFILNNWCNSLGLLFSDFFKLSLWTDPISNGGFPEGWTVFYWAWWVAYAPMMGLFVARISRGRTIRQVVIGELVYGSLGCWVFFAIWGGYAIHLQTSGGLDVYSILKDSGWSNNVTIVAILKAMPGGKYIFIPVFTVLCSIFLATTLNSAAYTLLPRSPKTFRGRRTATLESNPLGPDSGILGIGAFVNGSTESGAAFIHCGGFTHDSRATPHDYFSDEMAQ